MVDNIQHFQNEPFGLKFYRAVSRASGLFARAALKRRLQNGKEDESRINERMGKTKTARPEGPLIWIHGASVGESLSVLPLVERLSEQRPEAKFLVTTGTVTSARLMDERLPPQAIHQFIPIDHPDFVQRFLDHWKPDAAFFVESEFWPNLILMARAQVKTMALVNGRVSPKSFERWTKRPHSIRYLLSAFDLIMAQDNQNAARLEKLSGQNVEAFGNLKNAAAPLPGLSNDVETIQQSIGDRPIWLAASTHPGEEQGVIEAHRLLSREFPDIMTLLAPRHPERGAEILALVEEKGLNGQRRSIEKAPRSETSVYIADTLGELGLFYRLSSVSFVGGGLTPKGGHNPLEPARLGSAILHGPYTFNFVETYSEMRSNGGAALVRNERELATAVRRLLADDKTRLAMSNAAQVSAEASAERILSDVSEALLTHLKPPSIAA